MSEGFTHYDATAKDQFAAAMLMEEGHLGIVLTKNGNIYIDGQGCRLVIGLASNAREVAAALLAAADAAEGT